MPTRSTKPAKLMAIGNEDDLAWGVSMPPEE